MFTRRDELPGFEIVADNSFSFHERLEEILEDAYLAEAASMRQFLSFEANRAAIRRNLRRLLTWVARHRPWAKGVLTVAQQGAALPHLIGSAAASLADTLGITRGENPVVLHGHERPWQSWFPDGPNRFRWHDIFRPVRDEIETDGTGRLHEDTYIVTRQGRVPPPNSR